MAETEKELKQLRMRLTELAEKSYCNNQYTFTGFLSLSEQSEFYQIQRQISHVDATMWGGYDGSERQMLRFGSEEMFGYEEPFPIQCIRIEPLIQKFADTLTHRDFLGALMNLGIERSTLGDIFLKDNIGYVYCVDTMAEFIIDNLDKVKHTHVKCSLCSGISREEQRLTEKSVSVSSERIDGIIAKLYQMSRNDSIEHFRLKKVFVNGRLCENNSMTLKAGDVVTVRGYGKFIYRGVSYTNKKGKLCVTAEMYVS